MNFSWLDNLLHGVVGIFSPLKNIQHWKIWLELKNWYARFKKWRDWYKEHVMNPMQQMQKLQRQLYDTYFAPVLKLVDHIRQLTSIIGIFNRKLAAKLNYQFLKVETYLLKPFNVITQRTNTLGYTIQGMLTPLGYLDRATLLNSVWRDAGLIKQILHNPWNQHPAAASLPAATTISQAADNTLAYIQTGGGPYQPDVDQAVSNFQKYMAETGS